MAPTVAPRLRVDCGQLRESDCVPAEWFSGAALGRPMAFPWRLFVGKIEWRYITVFTILLLEKLLLLLYIYILYILSTQSSLHAEKHQVREKRHYVSFFRHFVVAGADMLWS